MKILEKRTRVVKWKVECEKCHSLLEGDPEKDFIIEGVGDRKLTIFVCPACGSLSKSFNYSVCTGFEKESI